MALVENRRNDPPLTELALTGPYLTGPYLTGWYAPVGDELDVADMPVTGSIPPALSGLYVRNGPNPMFEPKGRYHVFDGDGMLHGVYLDDGRARYRNRWIRTDGLEAERRAGRALYGGMANADFPDAGELGGGPPMKNVANTNVIRHAGRTLCLWEAGLPTEVTWELDTVGLHDFSGTYAGTFSAHPKTDPVTGELATFGYGLDIGYRVISARGEVTHSVQIPLRAPVMMHDFVMTEDHAVFLDAPAVFDFVAFARGEPMLRWRPDNGTRFGVLPRRGTADDIMWIEVENCYVFHFMNAWTQDGKVIVDGARLSRMDIGLEEDTSPASAEGALHRWTIDLSTPTATCERLGELPGDLPRVSPRREGLRNRFGYLATFSTGVAKMGEFDSVTKHDFDGNTQTTHRYGTHQVAGEAVFAPDPDGAAEDDGWLLNFVTDKSALSTDLVILEAHDLDEVARVHLPRRVPFGFHGNWMPEA